MSPTGGPRGYMGNRLRVFGMLQVSNQVVAIVIPAGTRRLLYTEFQWFRKGCSNPPDSTNLIYLYLKVQKQREITLTIMHGKLQIPVTRRSRTLDIGPNMRPETATARRTAKQAQSAPWARFGRALRQGRRRGRVCCRGRPADLSPCASAPDACQLTEWARCDQLQGSLIHVQAPISGQRHAVAFRLGSTTGDATLT
jgi:hypothetical protein